VGINDISNFPQSLVVDPHDNVVLVTADTTSIGHTGLVRKLCPDGSDGTAAPGNCSDGSTPWAKSGVVGPLSVAVVDANGSVYAGGISYSTAGLGTPFIQKFDKKGVLDLLWHVNPASGVCGPEVCTSSPTVQGVRLAFDGGGNVVLASFGDPALGGGVNFGPTGGTFATFPTYHSPNIFLSAYDPTSGALQWEKQVETILASSVHGFAVGNQGQIIVAGGYSGSMQVDGQLLTTAVTESSTVVDSFLASFAEPAASTPTIGKGGTCSQPGVSFSTVPENVVMPATSMAGACAFYTLPTSTGATVTCTQPPNTIFKRGTTNVTCTAYDAFGHTATVPGPKDPPITVTVTDPPPPVLVGVPASITQQASGPNGAIVNFAPTVVDALNNPTSCSSCYPPDAPLEPGHYPGPPPICNPPPVLASCTPASGSLFQVGTTLVTCTGSDPAGRTVSATFSVTVTPPVYGGACSATAPCISGTCVDGVCCNTTATSCGTCSACNVPGSVGTCAPTPSGSACTGTNLCLQTYSCDGAGSCVGSNPLVCTASDQCHVAGTCANGACSNPAAPDGTACSTSKCTTGDVCHGGICSPGTAVSCDDGNPCTVDTCDANLGCQHTPGNAGTVCRAAAGACDVAATCSGASATCPPNGFLPATTTCRPAGGACDLPELCTGSSAACPADAKVAAGTVCHTAAGVCDTSQSCDGTNNACPADVLQPTSVQCRAPSCSAGVATQAAFCTGAATACPAVTTAQCGLFVCGATTCLSTCTSVYDCATSAYCGSGSCQPDIAPPAVTLATLPAYTNHTSLTVTGTATDNGAVASVQLLLNGNPVAVNGPDASGNVTAALTLAQGNNTITVQATDRAGNVGATQAQVFLDTTPPALTFASPQPNQAFGTLSVGVAVQVSTVVPATVSIGGGAPQPVPPGSSLAAATVTLPSAGSQTIAVTATDAAGNTASTSVPVLIDLSVPDVSINVADGARHGPLPGNLLPVSISVNDVGSTTLTLSTGGSFPLARGGGIVQTTVPLTPGTDSFVVNVTDEVGRSAQLMRTVIYDVTPPTGSIVSPPSGSFVRGTIDLSVNATDDLTGVASVTFLVDGATTLPGAAQGSPSNFIASLDTKTLADGPHSLAATLVDGVGNQAQLTSPFTVDNTPPTATVTAPAAGSFVNATISVAAAASDTGSGVSSLTLMVNGKSIGSCSGAPTCTLLFDTTTLPDGPFNVTATAVDGAGNSATSAQVTATSVNNLPKQFIVSPVAGTILTGSSVTVSVNVTDPYFASVECLLDGVSLGVSTSPTFSATVSLANTLDGLSTVTCNVHDKAGNVGTQSVEVTVQRWTFDVQPRMIELGQSRGTVNGELVGPTVSLMLPIAGKGLALVVPGGSPVPALSGAFEGHSTTQVLLTFDRGALVDAIRAGIAAGKIAYKTPFAVHLYAGAHEIDADLVTVVGDGQ
jgi:hypothetical protein